MTHYLSESHTLLHEDTSSLISDRLVVYKGENYVLITATPQPTYERVGPHVMVNDVDDKGVLLRSTIGGLQPVRFAKKERINRTQYEIQLDKTSISRNGDVTTVTYTHTPVKRTRTKDNGYGIEAAKRRSKKKALLQDSLMSETVPTSKKSRKKTAPSITWYPLENNKTLPTSYKIDWTDESTTQHAAFLTQEYLGMSVFGGSTRTSVGNLLCMPTGTGKTAVAVATIGYLQKALEKPLKIVITAPRSAIEAGGFLATILSWNETYPDNPINPLCVTTTDKFAMALDLPKTLKWIVQEMGTDGFVVMDEAHKYKSPTSKRNKKMQYLSHVPKLMVTATPIGNNIIFDKLSYLILSGYYNDKTDFLRVSSLEDWINKRGEVQVYDKQGRVMEHVWTYYKVMQEQWKDILYRPSIDITSLNMPELTTKVIQLDENDQLIADTKSLTKAYDSRMFDSFVDYWMEYVERLHQDENRQKALLEIVTQPDCKQPLIFYWNVIVKDQLIELLTKHGFQPQILDAEHSSADLDFNSSQPILIQYLSGAEAVEFKQSNTTIFYQNQTSYITLHQSRGRNVRRGMDHSVTHWHLISNEPLDNRVFSTAFNRQQVADEDLDTISQAKDVSMNDAVLQQMIDEILHD